MDRRPLVSVQMVTFNHVRYIAQAIESALSQKTDFDFEIVIGDDFSNDGTREIVSHYAHQYPEKVFALLREKNLGGGGKLNSMETFKQCRGKYLAQLEGDDYWNDPYKLQTQIKFLEANPQYVGCYHNTEERYEDDPTQASFLYCDPGDARSVSFSDLAYRNLIPTCSGIFRNRDFGALPEWFYELKMGDWPLHLINACDGDYWYIPKVMGVHRLHRQSTWMLQDADKNNQFIIDAYDVMIRGFGADKEHAAFLVDGRQEFAEGIQQRKQPATLKKRIKRVLINYLQKF